MKRTKRKRGDANNTLFLWKWLLTMAMAIAVGLFLPSLVTELQCRRTDNTREPVDLGSSVLSLTSDSAKLKKLGLFANMEMKYSEVAISNGKNMTAAQAQDLLYEIPQLIQGTNLPYAQFGKEDIEAVEPCLLVSDESDVTTIILWSVFAARYEEGKECVLSYIVDDETGLIVAASYCEYYEEYLEIDGTNAENWSSEGQDSSDAVRRIAANLSEMYKFTNTTAELDSSVSIGDNYRYSIDFYTDGRRELTLPVYVGEKEWQIGIG